MKILIVAYIHCDKLLEQLEGIICYDKFQVTESNKHYRVFVGTYNGGMAYFKRLYNQITDLSFSIEDSMFMAYPKFHDNNMPSFSTLVLKRKGNRYLRRYEER